MSALVLRGRADFVARRRVDEILIFFFFDLYIYIYIFIYLLFLFHKHDMFC